MPTLTRQGRTSCQTRSSDKCSAVAIPKSAEPDFTADTQCVRLGNHPQTASADRIQNPEFRSQRKTPARVYASTRLTSLTLRNP